jgi:uncharacterized damage-inducible protein DinB
MTELDRIADQLRRAHDGDPWYGSSLRGVLRGIDADAARHRVTASVHSIEEILHHVVSWQREVARRLRDGVAREPADGDWPTPGAWSDALEALDQAHRELLAALAEFPSTRLHDTVGEERDRPLGSGVSYYVMLHGLVQHNIAHTAQISLLRKALG